MNHMPQPRRFAWALVVTLLATMSFGTSSSVLAKDPMSQPMTIDPNGICTPGQFPTRWADELHPPASVRVLRSKGPNVGHVETVRMWDYVGHVVRAEYSSGSEKPYPWMQVGALTVKQYGWYYAMHWRGGKVSFTVTNPDNSTTTTTECYDLKDTTADQIYTAEQLVNGQWTYVKNMPSGANLKAMRDTWHMSLRKWQAKLNRTRLFLTGYRSGVQNPCGADSTGWKIYQKSLRDCGVKKLTLEETLREYFEPANIVNTRDHDIVADGAWRGDLGLLVTASGSTSARLYTGTDSSFAAGVVKQFGNIGTVLSYGAGNVDAADANGADDSKLLADLLMLVNDGSLKLKVARANGTSFGDPVAFDAPAGASRLLVGDFNGDLLADAGFLDNSSTPTLKVMLSNMTGGFAPAVDWSAPLALGSNVFVAAGDVNGDEKTDLITANGTGAYLAAVSNASCSNMTVWGVCPSGAVGAAGLGSLNTWLATSSLVSNTKNVVADYDRDGRDDIIVVSKTSETRVSVSALHAKSDGTFAAPQVLANQVTASWGNAGADLSVEALNVNPDGMADLVLVMRDAQNGNTKLQWLKATEWTTTAAVSMTPTTAFTDNGLAWSSNNQPF